MSEQELCKGSVDQFRAAVTIAIEFVALEEEVEEVRVVQTEEEEDC